MTGEHASASATVDHLSWLQTRLDLERDFRDSLTRGFALIASGFGGFAFFGGLAAAGERTVLPKAFALAATAIGVIVILVGVRHFQKMVAWVNANAFGDRPVPPLPDENRPLLSAAAATIIGLISFVALLFTG